MNEAQLEKMSNGKGFIAALDQSGGSTPKALSDYGIPQESYSSDETMYKLVHEMRSRIIKSDEFNSNKILGAILFERTMDSLIDGKYTADYLWQEKGIVTFLKIDKGLEDLSQGVQLMKPIPELESLLNRALKKNIFGTKMRSVIKEYNEVGIASLVKQQFQWAQNICNKGLVPIIEPEVDIYARQKGEIEEFLLKELLAGFQEFPEEVKVMFKLSLPDHENLYQPLMEDSRTVRVVALSGGYERDIANQKLSLNQGMIASFSRALLDGLRVDQSEEEFNSKLRLAIQSIYEASLN